MTNNIEPMQHVLEALHAYYVTFSTLNLSAIAAHFCEPCMSISPRGVFSAASRADLAKAFAPMIDDLRAKGYGRSEFTEPEVTMLGEAAAMVRGVAVRYTAAGPELERVRIAYLMHRNDAGWKIAVMVFAS